MNQHGVTFLEVIIVIAILMIVTSLVSPSLNDWSQRQNLEKDFYAALSKIEYLKIRARVTNGAAELTCSKGEKGSLLTYGIYDGAQSTLTLPSASGGKLIEGITVPIPASNILSGATNIIINNQVCDGEKAVFISSGQSGLVDKAGKSGAIKLMVEPLFGKEKFGTYQVVVNPTTGFIEKFKCLRGDPNNCKDLE